MGARPEWESHALARLREAGFREPRARRAVVAALARRECGASAREIRDAVEELGVRIGVASVYRTLELLSELHVVEKLNFGDGVARYDLRGETGGHHHHHLICVRCGSMAEIMDDWLLPLEERLAEEYGFTVLDHRLDFHGICRRCRENRGENDVQPKT